MSKLSISNASPAQLKRVGGSAWQGQSGTRFYFNDLPTLFGLELDYYNTGSLRSAILNGTLLSNTKAKRYLSDLGTMKVWVEAGQLHAKSELRPSTDCDYAAMLEAAINKRLDALTEADVSAELPIVVRPTLAGRRVGSQAAQ